MEVKQKLFMVDREVECVAERVKRAGESILGKIGEIMREETSNVEEICNTLARTEKGWIRQSIDNCMFVFHHDPLLKDDICKNEWFSDDLKRLDDDNVYRKLQGHWIIEMAEMIATVNARSIEDIKAFISRQKDNYKIPYETHPEDRPRQCIFVGTPNGLDFLPLDRSGNRRFAPVLVHPENVQKHILEDEKEAREYILQAWAEAMEQYRASVHELKLSKELETYLKVLQQQFMPEDTKVGIIQAWLDLLKEDYGCSIMNESIVGWKPIKSTHRFGANMEFREGGKEKQSKTILCSYQKTKICHLS